MDNYDTLDEQYIALDREQVRRTKNIKLIPDAANRRGGKKSYAEWAHVIGIFQTLMFVHCEKTWGNNIVDLGCGTGILAIAADPLVSRSGRYVGLDVNTKDIAFCSQHYPLPPFEFLHLSAHNAAYSTEQSGQKIWPIDDESADLVTALSVWTHLNESDAIFNLHETVRVLRPGGKAIITAFILDGKTPDPLNDDETGSYHSTAKKLWQFERQAYDSADWFTTDWADVPEKAIAFNESGLKRMLGETGLTISARYDGCWKENPGIFFQDILVLEKKRQ